MSRFYDLRGPNDCHAIILMRGYDDSVLYDTGVYYFGTDNTIWGATYTPHT